MQCICFRRVIVQLGVQTASVKISWILPWYWNVLSSKQFSGEIFWNQSLIRRFLWLILRAFVLIIVFFVASVRKRVIIAFIIIIAAVF